MPQIEKPGDLQLIAIIRFFAYAWQSPAMKKSRFLFHLSKRPKDVRRQSARIWLVMRSAVFGKIVVVYGRIDENGGFVRKRPARKMAITDKMVKNRCLSVRFQPFRTQFYGQTLQNPGFVRKSSSEWPKIYGQITEKRLFVRKMRFAYGQIIKNCRFVRKFE